MKNKEIEELLDKLKDKDWYEELDLTGTRWIELKQEETNLLLSYIEQLEEENDRLKEVVENLTTMTVNGDTKQIKNTAQYKLEQLENNRDKAIDKVQYIIDYGFDYDGFNSVESLKGLIDMLVDYARDTKKILKGDNNGD